MSEDSIKEAFLKVKQDIQILSEEVYSLNKQLEELKRTLAEQAVRQSGSQAVRQINQAHLQNSSTYPEEDPHKHSLNTLKTPIYQFSTGNDGVQAVSQAVSQAVRQSQKVAISTEKDPLNHIEEVSRILASLDNVKKELRSKFKKLTPQEMAVFSEIYKLEEQGFIVDYTCVAQKLSLSESAIRDYITRILKKGGPIRKTKENNKRILLSIAPEIKKIANLATIQKLREI